MPLLFQRLESLPQIEDIQYEFVFVDDGSQDDTWEQVRSFARAMSGSQAIRLSRNFGHQKALWSGLERATGDAVFVIDADLQDPPELIEQFVNEWKIGNEVVYGVRQKRKENLFKRIAYKSFYRLLKNVADIEIPLDAGDFCLMDRKVVDAILVQKDSSPFIRGARAWVGYEQVPLEYERNARAAGKEKYGLKQLMDLAINGLFSYSKKPVRWILNLGIALIFCSIVWGTACMVTAFTTMDLWSLETSTALIVLAVGMATGLNLTALGVVGEYMVKTMEAVQGRPVSIVAEVVANETVQSGVETLPLETNQTAAQETLRKAA